MRYVVVGSGISGLSAAIFLARQGHAVTVLEAASSPAPLLRGFRRQGLHFDTGFHCGGGLHEGGVLRRWLRALGVGLAARGPPTGPGPSGRPVLLGGTTGRRVGLGRATGRRVGLGRATGRRVGLGRATGRRVGLGRATWSPVLLGLPWRPIGLGRAAVTGSPAPLSATIGVRIGLGVGRSHRMPFDSVLFDGTTVGGSRGGLGTPARFPCARATAPCRFPMRAGPLLGYP